MCDVNIIGKFPGDFPPDSGNKWVGYFCEITGQRSTNTIERWREWMSVKLKFQWGILVKFIYIPVHLLTTPKMPNAPCRAVMA